VVTSAFTSHSNTVEMSRFIPFQRPGIDYINDSFAPLTFSATSQELETMIDNVGTLPGVTDGDIDEGGFLPFTLLNDINNTTRAFEALNQTNGRGLFTQMMSALEHNAEAISHLESLACTLDLLSSAMPTEVTARVSVELSGVRLNRTTGNFVGRVRVTNNSELTLAAPLSLIVDEEGNVRLVGEDGSTCRISPPGLPYMNLPVGQGGLSPGGTVEVILKFDNPELETIEVAPRVFSGAGAR